MFGFGGLVLRSLSRNVEMPTGSQHHSVKSQQLILVIYQLTLLIFLEKTTKGNRVVTELYKRWRKFLNPGQPKSLIGVFRNLVP